MWLGSGLGVFLRVRVRARVRPDLLDHGVACGEVLVRDVGRVNNGLGRQQAEALDGLELLLAQVDLPRGLALVEAGDELGDGALLLLAGRLVLAC